MIKNIYQNCYKLFNFWISGSKGHKISKEKMVEIQAQIEADRRKLEQQKDMEEEEKRRVQQDLESKEEELRMAK